MLKKQAGISPDSRLLNTQGVQPSSWLHGLCGQSWELHVQNGTLAIIDLLVRVFLNAILYLLILECNP